MPSFNNKKKNFIRLFFLNCFPVFYPPFFFYLFLCLSLSFSSRAFHFFIPIFHLYFLTYKRVPIFSSTTLIFLCLQTVSFHYFSLVCPSLCCFLFSLPSHHALFVISFCEIIQVLFNKFLSWRVFLFVNFSPSQ